MTDIRQWAEEQLAEANPEALFMDGLDRAIIGVTAGQAGMHAVVVYDQQKIIESIRLDDAASEEDFSEEDAWDHYGFNIQGAYVGEQTPIIIVRPEEE